MVKCLRKKIPKAFFGMYFTIVFITNFEMFALDLHMMVSEPEKVFYSNFFVISLYSNIAS